MDTTKDLKTCEKVLLSHYKNKLQHAYRQDNVERAKVYRAITKKLFDEKKLTNPNLFLSQIINTLTVLSDSLRTYSYAIDTSNIFQPWFRFTEPIIGLDRDASIVKNYKKISSGDKIYVWALQDAKGDVVHLSAVIVTKKNEHLCFGMGTKGENGKMQSLAAKSERVKTLLEQTFKTLEKYDFYTAELYTPDIYFEDRLFLQFTETGKTFLKLIASAEITEDYVQLLNAEFDNVLGIEVVANCKVNMIPKAMLKNLPPPEVYFNRLDVQQKSVDIDKTLDSEVKNEYKRAYLNTLTYYYESLNLFPLIGLYYSFTLKTTRYCYISSVFGKAVSNCTTFLQKLFNNTLLNCSYFTNKFLRTDFLASDPNNCKQNVKVMPISTCRKGF